jgi:hypothetical protein
MVQELTINIPQSYADISLRRWLDMQNEIENYKDNEDAVTAVIFYHLCGLDPTHLKGLSFDDYTNIKSELEGFINETNLPLQKFVTIDGIEYGFEPNLSQMAYGAYVDITKFETFTIDKNWQKIMNILYRPVERKKGDMYSIKPYTIDEGDEKWLNVGMDVHFGALFFFVHLSTDLLSSILKSTMEMELPHNIKQILQRSGNLIQPYTTSPMGMLQSSEK